MLAAIKNAWLSMKQSYLRCFFSVSVVCVAIKVCECVCNTYTVQIMGPAMGGGQSPKCPRGRLLFLSPFGVRPPQQPSTGRPAPLRGRSEVI